MIAFITGYTASAQKSNFELAAMRKVIDAL
jgi:hypothetical protein